MDNFACLESKLVIEVDGGQHGARAEYDEIRTQDLVKAGFRVLRFWNTEVIQEVEAVKERIGKLCRNNNPIPTPTLPLKGREKR